MKAVISIVAAYCFLVSLLSAQPAPLEPSFTVRGVVVDEKKAPLEGISVTVMPRDMFKDSRHSFHNRQTDKDGKYEFSNLALIDWRLSADKSGYISQSRAVLQATVNEKHQVDFTLLKAPPGGVIIGTVVDTNGRAIPGALVRNPSLYYGLRHTTTDDQGSYRLANVGRGIFGRTLYVHAPGFAPKVVKFVTETKKAPAKVDVTLMKGHRIRGKVVDENGSPIAEAYVHRSDDYRLFGGGDTALPCRTDIEGRFQFKDLPEAVTFTIRKDGYSSLNDQFLSLDGEEVVHVTLAKGAKEPEPTGTISGRVVDAITGASVKEFDVKATNSTVAEDGHTLSIEISGMGGSPDGKGEFDFESFGHDQLPLIMVEADGYQRGFVRNVVPLPEGEFEPLEIRLQPIDTAKLQTIAGEVVDAAGRGIGGVELRLIASAVRRTEPRDKLAFSWAMIRDGRVDYVAELNQFLTAMTDQKGHFKFTDVQPSADIELAYWGDGIIPGRCAGLEKLEPAERQEVQIVAVSTGRVEGRIDRRRFPQCDHVVLKSAEETLLGKISYDDLAYEVANVPAGSYELRAIEQIVGGKLPSSISHKILHRELVEVKSGETAVLDLD